MKEFLAQHLQLFAERPFYALLIVIWGIWFMNYKVRAWRHDSNPHVNIQPRQIWEHRKRIVIGGLTMLYGLAALPSIIVANDAQNARQQSADSSGGTPTSSEAADHPPDTFTPDTVYDQNDIYLYEVLGEMENRPNETAKFVTEFTLLQESMQTYPVDLTDAKSKFAKEPQTSMAILDLMRCLPYARLGYEFKRPAIKRIFQRFSWYHPAQSDMHIVEKQFTPTEKDSIAKIIAFEKANWPAQ